MTQVATATAPVEVGVVAPDFGLPDQHGAEVSLSTARGRRPVLLVFYPFAFTGVCTSELQELQAALPRLTGADGTGADESAAADGAGRTADVVAISCDPMFALRVFADAEGLSFPVLSDFWPHGAVAQAYGVFDQERGCARRGSFAIDRDGVVRWTVVNQLPDARNVQEYASALDALR